MSPISYKRTLTTAMEAGRGKIPYMGDPGRFPITHKRTLTTAMAVAARRNCRGWVKGVACLGMRGDGCFQAYQRRRTCTALVTRTTHLPRAARAVMHLSGEGGCGQGEVSVNGGCGQGERVTRAVMHLSGEGGRGQGKVPDE